MRGCNHLRWSMVAITSDSLYLHMCKMRIKTFTICSIFLNIAPDNLVSLFTPTPFGFVSPSTSVVAHTLETIHMKIHSAAAPIPQSSHFHSDVYIPSFTACRFPEELVYPVRSPVVLSQPPPVVSFRSGARKKAASLSMKPFQPLECRRSALLARFPPRIKHVQCTLSKGGTGGFPASSQSGEILEAMIDDWTASKSSPMLRGGFI